MIFESKYISSCCLFFYIISKKKAEVFINWKSFLVTKLNKFGIGPNIGLLHFHKGILPSYVADIFLSKTSVRLKGHIFGIREIGWYIETKSDDKESVLMFLCKSSVFFYP